MSISYFAPSPDGAGVAVGVAMAGSESACSRLNGRTRTRSRLEAPPDDPGHPKDDPARQLGWISVFSNPQTHDKNENSNEE